VAYPAAARFFLIRRILRTRTKRFCIPPQRNPKNDSAGQADPTHRRGNNTKTTKFAQFEGSFSDERHFVDFSERRRYIELACKLLGFLREHELSAAEQPVPPFHMTIRYVGSDGNGRPSDQELPDWIEGEAKEIPSDATRHKAPPAGED
jgi:hypothetical protein